MANNDYAVGGNTALPENAQGKGHFILKAKLDCSDDNQAQNDIAYLLHVPDNTEIVNAGISVVTAEGGTLTVDLGLFLDDGSYTEVDADGFLDGVNANSATDYCCNRAAVITQGAPSTIAPAYGLKGVVTTAASLIGVTFKNAADTAVIHVWVECIDIRKAS